MPTRPSPGSSADQAAVPPGVTPAAPTSRAAHSERAARVRFRRAVTLMLMTLVWPGTAQLVAGNRRIARIAMWTWVGLLGLGAVLVGLLLWNREALLSLALQPTLLLLLRMLLIAGALAWAALFVDAWRLGQPLSLRQNHRLAVVGINGFLSLTVAGSLLFGAHLVGVQRDFIITMFGNGTATGAHDGRYNVLLMGGDSGAGRWGLRPDSMTIASIDAVTGKTVLIGLPRNMSAFPFADGSVMDKQFPHGFSGSACEPYCYLNSVSTWAGDHPQLFKKSKNPGVDATIMAIEGITGLKVNYWAMVNLQGFKDLVDAVGGVKLNVRQPIPIGGLGDDVVDYVKPGVQTLNGMQTLWFARAREGSDDYSRMARQKCVMNAMLQQISPQTAVRNFEQIAKASTAMISTDVPRSELDRFVQLALKAKSQKISTVSLVPPLINTGDPDIDVIREAIQSAVDRSEGDAPQASKKARKKARSGPVTGGSLGSLQDGYAANQSDNLAASC
ncbi:LCP family protein [Nocardioides sp.]|uniref:LCP family protein n=1 Tax=Nocardioides sp. TaxID=35761 RepID=UPI00352775CE